MTIAVRQILYYTWLPREGQRVCHMRAIHWRISMRDVLTRFCLLAATSCLSGLAFGQVTPGGTSVALGSSPCFGDLRASRAGCEIADSGIDNPLSRFSPRSRLGLNVRPLEGRATSSDPAARPDARSMSFEAAYSVVGSWGLAGYLTGSTGRGFGLPLVTPGSGTASLRANESVGLGVIKSATWLSGDRLSLMVSQPLGGGGARIGAEGPLDASDTSAFVGQRPLGLRASGREVTTELRYLAPIMKRSHLGLSLINRSTAFDNPFPDERIMTIRFSTQF